MSKDDFQERRTKFIEKYKALLDELQVDIIAIPSFIPNDHGTWDTVVNLDIVDKKQSLIESPIKV